MAVSVIGAIIPSVFTIFSQSGDDMSAEKLTHIVADTSYMLPLQFMITFLLGALAARFLISKKTWDKDLEITKNPPIQQYVFGAIVGVIALAITQLITRLVPELMAAGETVAKQLTLGSSFGLDFILIFSAAVAAPLGEEIAYRGLIFKGLHDEMLRAKSKLITSLSFIVPALFAAMIFAMSHGGEGQSKQFWLLVLYGVAFAFIYWRSGSFYVPVFAHSVVNAINMFILTFYYKPTSLIMYVLIFLAPFISIGIVWLTQKVLKPKQ